MRSIFDTLDVHRPGQTKPRSERMRVFRRWYLSGMENVVEKQLPHQEFSTLVPLEKESNTVLQLDERLVIRELGRNERLKAYMLPVPPQGLQDSRFSLLSNQPLFEDGMLEVLFCSVSPKQAGQSQAVLSMSSDFSGEMSGLTRLACKSAQEDVITLPASTRFSSYPFDKARPFSYLHYDHADLIDYAFVVIIDKAVESHRGWLIAEFADIGKSLVTSHASLRQLLTSGIHLRLLSDRPMVNELRVPALHSSLLAFKLDLGPQTCGDGAELFTPLLRQYIAAPPESKFFVNVKDANISLHGIAPFMPPPLRAQAANNDLSLQLWSDPSCNSSVNVSLDIDVAGSMGKLVMRYRLVFAAFPLLVVALVLRKQFKTYDETGKKLLPTHHSTI